MIPFVNLVGQRDAYRLELEKTEKEALDSGVLFELRFNRMIPKRHFCVVKRKHAVLSNAAARLLETMGLIERG